jgi:hypothetical protein
MICLVGIWDRIQIYGYNFREGVETRLSSIRQGTKGEDLIKEIKSRIGLGGKELQSGPVGEWQTTRTARELGILSARQLESIKLESRGSSSNRKNWGSVVFRRYEIWGLF